MKMWMSVVSLIALTLIAAQSSAHDEADYAHQDLSSCVSVSTEHDERHWAWFSVTNNCSVLAYVSVCWELPEDVAVYGCMHIVAMLEFLNRFDTERHPTEYALAPGRTAKMRELAKPGTFRLWHSACAMRQDTFREMSHAREHCGMRAPLGDNDIIVRGYGEYEETLVSR